MQKQQELQELFEENMSDEMKALFEELQKMLDEIRKEDVQEMLEKMEMSAEDIEEELDRSLELFKQLEFDKRLTEAIEKLNEMAKDQMDLAKETEEKDGSNEEMSEEQKALNEAFEESRRRNRQRKWKRWLICYSKCSRRCRLHPIQKTSQF